MARCAHLCPGGNAPLPPKNSSAQDSTPDGTERTEREPFMYRPAYTWSASCAVRHAREFDRIDPNTAAKPGADGIALRPVRGQCRRTRTMRALEITRLCFI